MDPTNDLQTKKAVLQGFVRDYQARSQQLPSIHQALELVDYQIAVASSFPNSVAVDARDNVFDAYNNTTGYWSEFANAFPTSSLSSISIGATGLALEKASSNIAFQTISAISVGYGAAVTNWATGMTEKYEAIQERNNAESQVRNLIVQLIPHRVEEFDRTVSGFASALTDIECQTEWGIRARNLIEHIKGDCFVAAQRVAHKQKVSWTEFANHLARDGVGSASHAGLIAEEVTHKIIHLLLTNVAKNLSRQSESDLRGTRAQLNDHLFAVLSLVDEDSLKSGTPHVH